MDLALAPAERRTPPRTVRAPPGSPMIDAVAESRAWQEAGALFVRVLGELVQAPFSVVPERSATRSPVFVADVSLSRSDLELTLSIVVERTSMLRMAKRLTDSEEVEIAESLVLETANVLMGNLRASLAAEELRLALGLPEVGSPARGRRRFDGAPLRAHLSVASAIVELDVWLCATPAGARRGG